MEVVLVKEAQIQAKPVSNCCSHNPG